MMNIKIWSSLAVAALATGGAAAQQEPAETPFPGGTIEHALEKIFEGEGGEAGLGMTKMVPRVTIPALRADQLRKAVSGNTVRANGKFAIYFRPDGKAEGWVVKYRRTAASECKPSRPGYFVDDNGVCLAGYDVKIDGKWRIDNDQICMPGIFHGSESPPTPETCHYMALVLYNVAFFNTRGDMMAKGWTLAKGDVRARSI